MRDKELIPHLFRTEYSKIIAVLCKHFGFEHLASAEDIASDTFTAALENWSYHGIPENPEAWLYVVAKNKARNFFHHNQWFSAQVAQARRSKSEDYAEPEVDLSDDNIRDSQLRMLFAVCHHAIPTEAQIALALRTLCGFGIDEIASALLSSREAINKRLFRARDKLRKTQAQLDFPSSDMVARRLATVLTTLYLVFSEGYYSENHEAVIREELCLEAMRLTHLLIDNPSTNHPEVNALMALMCFQASRFPARRGSEDQLILYDEQDPSLWDQQLVARGAYYLAQAASGQHISKYHLEATIASWYITHHRSDKKWPIILSLFDQLMLQDDSPIVALNRIVPFSKVHGTLAAIKEAEKLQLTENQYYLTLLGKLYHDIDLRKSQQYLQKAYALARTNSDRKLIRRLMVDS